MAQTYVINQRDSNGRLRSQIVIPFHKVKPKPSPPAKPPAWVTPARQEYLIKLWIQYGNKCLLGHPACPIREHYIHDYQRQVLVPQAKSVLCVDGSGNPIKDNHGNPLYITVYPLVKDILHDKQIRQVETDDGFTHLFGLYDLKSETIIKDWIADDRAQRQAEWQAEYKARHARGERTYPLHGRFSGISQEIFYDSQPAYYLEGLGISGLTFKPFAKVRLSSSLIALHVDLGDLLKPMSKNKRRKAVRYGKIPIGLEDRIKDACWLAVKSYLNH
jgi:hypothetical protein